MSAIPLNRPRQLDLSRTFNALVTWIHGLAIQQEKAPGFVVGISGTDSILTFLACAKAFERAGKPGRVLGIHFGPAWPPSPAQLETLGVKSAEKLEAAHPNHDGIVGTRILPWLQKQVPGAELRVESAIDYEDDFVRWLTLIQRSRDVAREKGLPAGQMYWVVGTRNMSEQTLGNYSNISKAVSLQPINHLWKSEVLQMCRYLGVPEIAMQRSCQVDCACGRFELAALHIPQVDAILMAREGLLSPDYLDELQIPSTRLAALQSFVDEQRGYNKFKDLIPHKPSADTCILEI